MSTPNAQRALKISAIGAGILLVLGAVANITGIFSFTTGLDLPHLLGTGRDAASPAASGDSSASSESGPATESQSVTSVVLPSRVFDFASYDNPSRQSYLLTPGDTQGTAYAYGYWQDPDEIWVDATISAGGKTAQAAKALLATASSSGQRVVDDGQLTCVWDQDSDPNTPMHTEKCFLIDVRQNRALVIWTESSLVGDSSGARLAEEIWNLSTWK